MSLPDEILDYILGFLQSDTTTLKVCSQSHPKFSHLVERHLYASVTVQDTDDEDRKVLRSRPHIANYVRALEIRFGIHLYQDPKSFLEEISLILPKLSMLRKIGLYSTKSYPFSWRMMPESFCLAFLDCLCLPSMMDVCIQFIAFPLSVLSQCKHIRNLSLEDWRDEPFPIEDDVDHANLPTIDSLTLRNFFFRSLPKIITWIQLRHPSSLTLSDASLGSLNFLFPQILIGCSHSLTSLDADISIYYRSYHIFSRSRRSELVNQNIPIPLPVLPNLQQLTVRTRLDSQYMPGSREAWQFFSAIPAITGFLETASSIKRLTLDCRFSIHDHQDAHNNIADILCSSLHSLLVGSASPTGSIKLHISSIREPYSPFTPPNIILAMFADCPDLVPFVKNGKLILTPVFTDVLIASPEPQIQVQDSESDTPVPSRPSISSSTNGGTPSLLRSWFKKLMGLSMSLKCIGK